MNDSSLWSKILSRMNPPVFFGSAFIVIGFCIFGGFFTETASKVFNIIQKTISDTFGWYYALVVTAFVIYSFWLMISKYGTIQLGPPDSRPEFSYFAWFTMLFSAGMGTGIVFWSVAEPLNHYANPPFGNGSTPEAARLAMRYTFFHWGLHPWAIYIILGVAIAYYHFRKDLPLAPRSILYPIMGERMHGWAGHVVDILCTVGTLLGVSTSLGLGAMQINTGIAQFFSVPQNIMVQVTIIGVITIVATISVVSGIQAGIRRLSMTNIVLSGILLLFVFIAGPTVYIMKTFVGSLGAYLQNLPFMSLWVNFTRDSDWQSQWTLFYWGWWISWSPFVGVFVARISKGRTIREFVFWVLLIPSLGTFFWLSVFGGTALNLEIFQESNLSEQVQENVAVSLHALLQKLPFATMSLIWATVVIVIFFITSSDSGSLVDDIVTSGGHPNPAKAQRVFWALSEGTVAATLLVVGGLRAIQDASISLGFFMSFILVITCFSLVKSFQTEDFNSNPTTKE